MSRVEVRQKRRDRGNNHDARQDRGEASKRRDKAEAALLLPRVALKHISLDMFQQHYQNKFSILMNT